MSARIVVGIIALGCVSICGFLSSLVQSEIVDKVNAKLPEGQRFNPFWWYAQKTWRLYREYRRLYPDGKLHVCSWSLGALMFAGILVTAWAVGFF